MFKFRVKFNRGYFHTLRDATEIGYRSLVQSRFTGRTPEIPNRGTIDKIQPLRYRPMHQTDLRGRRERRHSMHQTGDSVQAERLEAFEIDEHTWFKSPFGEPIFARRLLRVSDPSAVKYARRSV